MIIGVDKPHIVARQMIAGTRFGVWKCTQQSETVLAAGCGITAEAAFRYALSTASRRIIRE
ncbi:hypothetical protein C6P75_12465 [Burkholderia multivorans]|nr:hypothetical protein C6P75_12465 [Burkholderia multivorans]